MNLVPGYRRVVDPGNRAGNSITRDKVNLDIAMPERDVSPTSSAGVSSSIICDFKRRRADQADMAHPRTNSSGAGCSSVHRPLSITSSIGPFPIKIAATEW